MTTKTKRIYCKRCKAFINESKFYSNNSQKNITAGRFKSRDYYCSGCRKFLTKQAQKLKTFKSLSPNPFEYWKLISSSKQLAHFGEFFPGFTDFSTFPFQHGPYLHFYNINARYHNYYLRAFNYLYVPSKYIQDKPFKDYLMFSPHQRFDPYELTHSKLTEVLFQYRSIRHLFTIRQKCLVCSQLKSTYLETTPTLFKSLFLQSPTLQITQTNFSKNYRTKNGWSHICNSCKFERKEK